MQKANNYMIIIAVSAALAGLLFGLDTAIISGALHFIVLDFNLSNKISVQEYIVSAILLGAVVGTILSGYLAYHWGRKKLLITSGLLFAIFSLLSAQAQSATSLIFFRLGLGCSVGMSALVAPIYLSEMSSKFYRGSVITMYQVMVYVGILLAFIIDTYFSYSGQWRWMLGIIAIPAIIMVIMIALLPNSPRWLMMKQKNNLAQAILNKIRVNKLEVQQEMSEITASLKQKKLTLSSLIKNKYLRSVLFLGVVLQFMQQFTGINMVLYYAPKIFSMAGLSSTTQQMWASIGIGIINVLACIGSMYFIDKHGRKPLMFWGFLGMGLSLAGLALMFALGTQTHFFVQLFAILFIVLFLIAFAFSAGPVVWILCAEIFPLQVRDSCMIITVVTNWLCNFILASNFLTVLNYIGSSFTFLSFAIINFLGIGLIMLYVPETRGVSLEKIQGNLVSGIKLRDIGEH